MGRCPFLHTNWETEARWLNDLPTIICKWWNGGSNSESWTWRVWAVPYQPHNLRREMQLWLFLGPQTITWQHSLKKCLLNATVCRSFSCVQDQNPSFIGPSSSLGKTDELQNKGRIKSVVSAVKVRKKQYGELLQGDVFGLGRETRAGMDGVIVNFPEHVNFRAAN